VHMQVNFESPKELAERLGWPVRRVRLLIQANQLRHIRIGRTIHVPEGAIEEFLDANMVKPNFASDRAHD
ncbi:MAG: helix-turn-helix domain-containing protein, partial [Parachlamydiaceae bacterium]